MLGIPVQSYPEMGAEPISGKKLRAMSVAEVQLFNGDLVNIANQYGMDAIRAAIEEYQEQIFIMVRQVMDAANNPYGGAGALGDTIAMRPLRAVDVGIAADIWDADYTAQAPPVAVAKVNADTMGEEEANIIFGVLSERGTKDVITAYQWVKGGKTSVGLTLPFNYADVDRACFVKLQAPIIQFPEEVLTFNVCCVRAQWSYHALVGIHAARARNLTTITT